jgi:hypothetical protein
MKSDGFKPIAFFVLGAVDRCFIRKYSLTPTSTRLMAADWFVLLNASVGVQGRDLLR